MAYEIVWKDSAVCEFRETTEVPDGRMIWATWSEAKGEALAQAITNRDDFAACVRRIRRATRADAIKAP